MYLCISRQCYLRLATPAHARALVGALGTHSRVQKDGLDAKGDADTPDGKALTGELLAGRREELYWGQVPEKVRRAAVDKAIAGSAAAEGGGDAESKEAEAEGRKRKRRKKK